MRIALKGGAYQTRSLIANAQRCINLYAEANPEGSQSPVTHYPTPGRLLAGTAPNGGPIRGGYTATNGAQYVVSGAILYHYTYPATFSAVGTLGTSTGAVSMADNGTTLVLVDGAAGYRVTLATDALSQITDPGFIAADAVAYADGYFIVNRSGTRQWAVSDVQAATFQPLDFASKEGAADMLQTVGAIHREVWLFGAETIEVYFNSGDIAFPYQRMPGVFIQHGCAAKHSVAQFDLSFFWLGQEAQGSRVVFKSANYQAVRISTHAIEKVLASYPTVSDAIGWTYQQEGHVFYVLTFPSADATWVYDTTTGEWHQRAWMDSNGALHRVLDSCCWSTADRTMVGDYRNGNIYELRLNTYDDNGDSIYRLRSFPTLQDGEDDRRVLYQRMEIDIETGVGLESGTWQYPQVNLRWSDDGGATWGNPVLIPLGDIGNRTLKAVIRRLGIGRRRVFEVSWDAPVATALNGAWIDAKALGS